ALRGLGVERFRLFLDCGPRANRVDADAFPAQRDRIVPDQLRHGGFGHVIAHRLLRRDKAARDGADDDNGLSASEILTMLTAPLDELARRRRATARPIPFVPPTTRICGTVALTV